MPRTIIVGDVHGCAAELESLLEKVAFVGTDRLVFVGDLIARGPDSSGVLALFRDTGAMGVRGNHEQRMLLAHAARAKGQHGPRLGPSHYQLLHELDEAEWRLLSTLPLSLDLPEHDLRIVHAGVYPSKAFEDQDEWTLMHIRSIAPDGTPSEKHDFTPWAESYKSGPHIAFGHNSRLKLQLHHNATGLDTGCVYGGSLTALVLEARQVVPRDQRERSQLLVSVPAQKSYYAGVPPRGARRPRR